MSQKLRVFAVILAMVLALVAFASVAVADEAKTIGIAIYSMGADSCVALVEEARAAAAKLGYEIKLLDANADPSVQADQMATFVSEGVDAIILNPTDTTSLIPSIQAAIDAGIPVVCVGMEMAPDAMKLFLFFAGADDYLTAKIGCMWIAENLDGKDAQVAIITGPAGTDPTNKAIKAYTEALEGTDIVDLGAYDGQFDTAKALAITEDLLVQHPEIDAIYCQDHVMAAGAAEAVADAGMEGKVAIVAAIGMPNYLSYIKDGLITIGAYVPLYKAGYFAVMSLGKYFEDNTIEFAAKYYVTPVITTVENVDEVPGLVFEFEAAE
jgi:ABC-type sugar transport system substrate-binding protein